MLAALASYVDARHHQGQWLVRMEDLDPPREDPSAPAAIAGQLRAFHLHWDGEILFQSERLPAYEAALGSLAEQGLTYACTCSRRQQGPVYPGACDGRYPAPPDGPHAIRLRVAGRCAWQDRLFGTLSYAMKRQVGDFIVKRKDGLHAYQLAVVVDDRFQQITHVVRGADLLDSTPRQLSLYRAWRAPPPAYLHLPVLADAAGAKLSKQTQAAPVNATDVPGQLRRLLGLLGQPIPRASTPAGILAEAARHWDVSRIPARRSLRLAGGKGAAKVVT